MKRKLRQTRLDDFLLKERKTYTQDWTSYNNAQTKEKVLFYNIVNELLNYVEFNDKQKKRGRPTLSKRDMLFSVIAKVYNGFSSRRSISDLKLLQKAGYISKTPHFNSIINYLNNPEFEYHIKYLIKLSSLPLLQVENKFAVDASGFSTAKYEKWSNVRTKKKVHKVYKKAHVISGVLTNIITSIEISDGTKNDSPFFPNLVTDTAEFFEIKEVSADKGYLSRTNYEVVSSVGGVAFIPFKKNVSGRARGSLVWKRMFKYFSEHRTEFMKHYHLRSNAETVFSMIKRKFGGYLRSKKDQAQRNEILLKALCHNIVVLIHELYELGIDIDFYKCARLILAQK